MAYNGSGTFSLVSGNPVTTGTTISSTWANNTLSDIATNGLTNCITKDGQTTITANLPMATFILTGLGSGASARTNSAKIGDVQDSASHLGGTVAGTNTITAALTPAITAYAAGQLFSFIPANSNTGATTLNLNSVGAKSIFRNGAALIGGEIKASSPVAVLYDGTQFQLVGNAFKETTAVLNFHNDPATSVGAGTGFYASSGIFASEANANMRAPFKCKARNLYVNTGGSPGVGETFAFTLRVNGADTALTATISDAATTAADTTNVVAIAAGDLLCIKVVGSGGASSSGGANASLELLQVA